MTTEDVQILQGTPGRAKAYLRDLWDESTGRYFKPVRYIDPYFAAFREAALKEVARLNYMSRPDLRNEDFEAAWPATWAQLNQPKKDWNHIVAVLDSGLLLDHPSLRRHIEISVDCTGNNDPEDHNGHGTLCALLLDDGTGIPPLLNLKVVGDDGYGTTESLVAGIQWVIDHYNDYKPKSISVNMSVGRYTKRWGLFECNGDCELCRTALEAARKGIAITAAAGNRPGTTACPAKAGLVNPGVGIFVVAASNYDQSGAGNFSFPSTMASFMPVGDE